MFKNALRAENVVFLNNGHNKLYLCNVFQIFQATLLQGAVYLLFLGQQTDHINVTAIDKLPFN